jgi:N-acyl-D-amino-acid deacylase
MRLGIFLLVLAAALAGQSFLITNANVVDGTGAKARAASVRVEAGRITGVGGLKARVGDTVVDARGLTLAPGFIDLHNHSDRGLNDQPQAPSQVSQGITTAVMGVDGGSPFPVADWVARRKTNPPALNVGLLVGHATIRTKVMGTDYQRAARPDEVAKMAALVDQAMREGALGISTGLEYEVGSYSTTEEVVALAKVVAQHGGLYMSHIRDEADKSFDALREILRIADEARVAVHVSHIKLGTVGVWGKSREAVELLANARRKGLDVTADCYPYEAWASTITVLVPDKQYDNPASVKRGLDDVGGGQNVTVVNCREHPDYEFKNLEEIAQKEGITAVDAFIKIVKTGGASVVARSMKEDDIRTFYMTPWISIASDGGIGMRHPRAAGTFPRVLGRYVREQGWLTLEEAVRKMTSLPAARLHLVDRGAIRTGYHADLVLFDAARVMDQATFPEPAKLSTGIEKVWVNGELVWDGRAATGRTPGVVITRP